MHEIEEFEKRLKLSSDFMKKQSTNQSLAILKSLQRDLRDYLNIYQIEQCDKLSEMQIAIYNNLACLYEKKGKYKSSLYHLEIAEKLQNYLFVHKFQDEAIPIHAILKMATTYSNLSAIHSKLGDNVKAISSVQFAIQLFKRQEQLNQHQNLIFLFYNYSMLLHSTGKYVQSSKYSLQGLKLSKKYQDTQMILKYQELLQILRDKLTKLEMKKERTIKKYLKGEVGVIKKINSLFQISHNNDILQKSEQSDNDKQKVLKFQISSKFSPAKRKTFLNKHKTIPYSIYSKGRLNSTNTSFKRQINKSSSTHTDTFLDPLLEIKKGNETKYPEKAIQIKKSLEDEKGNKIIDFYGMIASKDGRFHSSKRQDRINARMKESKRKVQNQICDLNKKNSLLEKIIQKMYLSQNK